MACLSIACILCITYIFFIITQSMHNIAALEASSSQRNKQNFEGIKSVPAF